MTIGIAIGNAKFSTHAPAPVDVHMYNNNARSIREEVLNALFRIAVLRCATVDCDITTRKNYF